MSNLETVLAYHQRTKHSFHRYAPSLGYMDWANQPHPFRQYQGAAATPLALERQPLQVAYDRLYEPNLLPPVPVDGGSLADFFRYSLALSAWKQSGTSRWALRVNPSSGNLHPTEAYVLLDSPADVDGTLSLYHYVSDTHSLERRASLPHDVWHSIMGGVPPGSFLVGLSSIIWKEAWKYGERSFRYCQHDMGHAVAALRLSAALCGWKLVVVPTWSTDNIAALLGLDRRQDFTEGELEEAELLAIVMPGTANAMVATKFPPPSERTIQNIRSASWFGHANRLSREHVAWPIIDEVVAATRMPQGATHGFSPGELDNRSPPSESPSDVDAHWTIYRRRSGLALDGVSSVSRDVFLRMVGRTLVGLHPPWDALYWRTTIHLAIFVHRIEGLAPGLYLLVRDASKTDLLKDAMHGKFIWKPPAGVPIGFPLYLLWEADCRETARALSCHQDIAADGFFSLAMIAEFAEPIRCHGAWFYRNLFWEAGMIGQVLYLEAEAAGFGATGIGCYFDDPVHEVLGLPDNRFQDLYHFTVGVPIPDHRVQTSAPYSQSGGTPT